MTPPTLLAVPNVSEGRDAGVIAALANAFTTTSASGGVQSPNRDGRDRAAVAEVRLLDVHSDPDHHRSVFTLAGEEGALIEALGREAAEAPAPEVVATIVREVIIEPGLRLLVEDGYRPDSGVEAKIRAALAALTQEPKRDRGGSA